MSRRRDGTTASRRSTSSSSRRLDWSDGRRTVKSPRPDPLGDDEALEVFEAMYAAYYRKVVVYVARRTRSAADADDVVASTFLVAWNRIDVLADADEPLAWLYAVAYRTLLSHWRDTSRTAELADKAASEYVNQMVSVEETVQASDRLDTVTAAMGKLSETDQELLRLIGWEQQTHAEIASILGISRVLVRTRLRRARRRLQAAYERESGQPMDGSE